VHVELLKLARARSCGVPDVATHESLESGYSGITVDWTHCRTLRYIWQVLQHKYINA
jgi:hypothetical protein